MKWKVGLKGDEAGLKTLSNSFEDDPEIIEEDGDFFLQSELFDGLNDAKEIRNRSEDIVQAVRSFGKRDSLEVEDLEVSSIRKISDDGSAHLYLQPATATLTANATANITVVGGDEDGEKHQPADRTYEWTKLAIDDPKVAELAELLENGESWVNLYRIFEFIRDNVEGDGNITSNEWWSNNEKDLFTFTANSRDAIGNDARHADQRPGPEDPMSHAEAKRLIGTLVDHWLRNRG